jgi:hypothetical protein
MVKQPASKVLFWCAIAVQVAGAHIIIWDGRPLYQQLVTGATNVGSPKDYALDFTAIVIMQVGYWAAYRLQPHLRFRRNVPVGHLLCCIGEVSSFLLPLWVLSFFSTTGGSGNSCSGRPACSSG